MADATAAVNYDTQEVETNTSSDVIKTSEVLVIGAICAIDVSTGKAENMDDLKNLIPSGIAEAQSQGDPTALTGDGTVKVSTRQNKILRNVTITGLSARSDKYKPVYMTDNQTFTLTRPSCGLPVGFVDHWVSGTTGDIYLLSKEAAWLFSYTQGDKFVLDFGLILSNALTGTAEAVLWILAAAKKHFTIDSLVFACASFDAHSVAGAQSAHLEIAGVATTGGVVTLACTDVDTTADQGVAASVTAITALNEVHIGDQVELVMAASGTGFTVDCNSAYHAYALCTLLPGA